MTLIVGVLALQGAVEEHVVSLQKLECTAREIKVLHDLEGIDGIICPGGESTTMAIVGEKGGLFPALKQWVKDGRPIWGTCAGMILLSDHAIKQASGGQTLVGGLDVHVCRNYFGSQVYSCEYDIETKEGGAVQGGSGIFIRAPAILKCGPGVEVLGTVNAAPHPSALAAVRDLLQTTAGVHTVSPCPTAETYATANSAFEPVAKKPRGDEKDTCIAVGAGFESTLQSRTSLKSSQDSAVCDANTGGDTVSESNVYQVAVAVRHGNILATAFHPELSDDLRWHRFFLDIVATYKGV